MTKPDDALPAESVDELVDDPSAQEDEEVVRAVRYSITSYGADYPVDALVTRLVTEEIEIPEFQRKFVWTLSQSSRFVESLLLGLPVPGIFLSKNPENQKLLIIDGLQRLQTLKKFYDGVFQGREFALKNVVQEFMGKTYKTLEPEDRRRLDNAIIHAIVVIQEDPQDNQSSLYNLFERINTGGTPLYPQEIRACIYSGVFSDLLTELSTFAYWMEIYGKASPRGKDQELILRFFALYYSGANYARPMKKFLNGFMGRHRDLQETSKDEFTELFETTVAEAAQHLGPKAFRPVRNLNVALLDAFLVATAIRLQKGPIRDTRQYAQKAEELTRNQEFQLAYTTGTTDETNVATRIRLANEAFANVK